MRLLFVLDTFPLYGGTETFQFAKSLQQRGHEVKVCTSSITLDGELRSGNSIGGIGVKFLPSMLVPGAPYILTPLAYPEIVGLLREYRPDVAICMHYVMFSTNMGALAAYQMGIPVLLGIRGPGTSFGSTALLALKKVMVNTIGKITIGVSRKVLFDSMASMRAYDGKVKEEKRELVYSVVDSKKFPYAPNEDSNPNIVAVSTLTKTKDISTLLRAMPKVIEQFSDANVRIVGDGIERNSLERLSQNLGIQESVEFLGYRADIQSVLLESNIFVLPSMSEGVSRSLLEAAATGLACVATNVGGSPEIIYNGLNGFLFTPGDYPTLSDRLLTLCVDKTMRTNFGKALSLKVRSAFDVEPVVSHLEGIIRACAR